MSKQPHARISLTLPPEVLAEADRLADQLDRSRSWVISEAIRRYAETRERAEDPGQVRNRDPLGGTRLTRLLADMKLTPEQRVRMSEEAAGADRPPGPGHRAHLLAFNRFEDYLAWDLEAWR